MAESSQQPEVNMLPPWGCNICLEEAQDPVCTTCGHLFCWPCLYPWVCNMRKPCPVCQATITVDANVVPVYVSTASGSTKVGSNNIPPRPAVGPPSRTTSRHTVLRRICDNEIMLAYDPMQDSVLNSVGGEESQERAHIFRDETEITQELQSYQGDGSNLGYRIANFLKHLLAENNRLLRETLIPPSNE